MSREPSSPHMRLAADAGLVDADFFPALCVADAALASATLLAEFWDTCDERTAWAAANLPDHLHSRLVKLHDWCVEKSSAWARGCATEPAWAPLPVAAIDAVSSSAVGALVTPSSRNRYSCVPLKPHILGVTEARCHASSHAPVPVASKRRSEEQDFDKAMVVTLDFAQKLGSCSKLMMELGSSSLSPEERLVRLKKVIKTQSPASGSLRSHNLAFRRLVDWCTKRGRHGDSAFHLCNVGMATFLEDVSVSGTTVPQATASSLKWWLSTFDVSAGFDLRASIVRAEIKTPFRETEHAAEQAKPFELAHMEQAESVCVRASNRVHKGMAGWVANLAHAGLRGEDAQRHVPYSGALSADAIGGVSRKPKPQGVNNLQWASLRSGVLDQDWGLHAWDNLFSIVKDKGLDFTLPGLADDMNSFIWSRHASKHEQVMAVRFVLSHPEGIRPVEAAHVLEFTPHSPRFFYDSVGSSFGFTEDERRNFGNWAKGSSMPARYDASVCGEQLVRRAELLGLLRCGWSPPPAGVPGLPRTPLGAVGLPRTQSSSCLVVSTQLATEARGIKRAATGDVPLAEQQAKKLRLRLASGMLAPVQSSLGDRTVHKLKSQGPNGASTCCGLSLAVQGIPCDLADELRGQGYSTCGRSCFGLSMKFDAVLDMPQ